MAISGCILNKDVTSIAVTGGTAVTFTTDGVEVKAGKHVANTSEADFRLQQHLTFKNFPPKRRVDGTFSLGTRIRTTTVPYLEASTGMVHYHTIKIEESYAVAIPAANIKSGRFLAAQTLFDSDLEAFNTGGSTD